MKTAVVGEWGRTIRVDTGLDLTGWEKLTLDFRLPDETTIESRDSVSDGVSDDGSPTAGIVTYDLQQTDAATITATAGEVRVHVTIFKTGSYNRISNPAAKFTVVNKYEA